MLHFNNKIGITVILLLLCWACKIKPNLSLYSDHPEILSDYYQVKCDGRQQPVFYGRPAGLLLGEWSGKGKSYTLNFGTPIHSFETIPANVITNPRIDGEDVHFKVEQAANFFIRINNNYVYPLMVSVAAPVQLPMAENVLTFEAGIHDAGVIKLKDNQTLFLKKGAYVHGTVIIEGVENVKICGAGMLVGKNYKEGSQPAGIYLNHSQKVTISGVSLIDSPAAAIVIDSAEKIEIDNVKIIGNREQRMGDDAINIFNSQQITINNIMSNTRNNSVALMNKSGQVNHNITVKNATFWKGDYGNVLEIGYLAENMFLKNCTFENINIAHLDAGAAINISSNANIIEDLYYTNIKIFDSRFMIYNVNLDQQTTIKNVQFKNQQFLGTVPAYSNFKFHNQENANAFSFEGLRYKGKLIKNIREFNSKTTDYSILSHAMVP
ncbi:glycosyl hydrolase family 28 protein [Persicobacter diffluens]